MPKLLIADDNEQITNILRDYASKEGFESIVAKTGTEALELFKTDIDLVLLDVMMPELDGFSVCKEIRRGLSLTKIKRLKYTWCHHWDDR